MMARFCPNCGTEVDDTAVFCPTCGQPIDQEAEAEMPAAPAWPTPETRAEGPGASGAADYTAAPRGELPPPAAPPRPDYFDDAAEARRAAQPDDEGTPARAVGGPADESTRVGARVPPPTVPPPLSSAAAGPSRRPRGGAQNLPVTMPVTLSAWLIGGGSALAALGAVVSLFDGFGSAIDLLALLALGAVAISVFLAASIPAIPHLRFVTLAVVLVAFGVALDRLGIGAAGVGTLLLFLGTAAAAIGAVLLELGRDQPLGGSQG